jgi:hypothetical protein
VEQLHEPSEPASEPASHAHGTTDIITPVFDDDDSIKCCKRMSKPLVFFARVISECVRARVCVCVISAGVDACYAQPSRPPLYCNIRADRPANRPADQRT